MSKKKDEKGFIDFVEDLENQPICLNCINCVYIGEGDSICDADDTPKLILDDWTPTDDFWWCNGSEYESDTEDDDD